MRKNNRNGDCPSANTINAKELIEMIEDKKECIVAMKSELESLIEPIAKRWASIFGLFDDYRPEDIEDAHFRYYITENGRVHIYFDSESSGNAIRMPNGSWQRFLGYKKIPLDCTILDADQIDNPKEIIESWKDRFQAWQRYRKEFYDFMKKKGGCK